MNNFIECIKKNIDKILILTFIFFNCFDKSYKIVPVINIKKFYRFLFLNFIMKLFGKRLFIT